MIGLWSGPRPPLLAGRATGGFAKKFSTSRVHFDPGELQHMSRIKDWRAVLGAMVLLAAVAAASYQLAKSKPVTAGDRRGAANTATIALPAAGAVADDNRGGAKALVPTFTDDSGNGRSTFIVVFKESPLATYEGTVPGIGAPEREFSLQGKSRIDVNGAQAEEYVDYLQVRQAQIETRMSTMMGRDVDARLNMQHAINAMVVDLSANEANAVRGMPEVRFVEEYREYEQDTDTGPALIGAPPIWNGANPGSGGTQYRGEGQVIGVIDSGINFGSPSFAAVGPVDGYTHINPLGAGNFLGTCASGGADAGRCNDKLIGGYDFVCGAPGNQCGFSGVREEPGFGDTNGHGSHTASTAAGNTRDALFAGALRRISGIAPHANIIAYDACYTNSAGLGLCPNVSTLAAVNQAVADGVVTAINYSISGGTNPWGESLSLAFLNAVNAGIYVAASAGNSGPTPNTLGHVQPWVASTAAVQHGRANFSIVMNVTGPAPVPAALSPLIVNQATGGVAFGATIPATTPLRISARINTTSDNCFALPANTYAGAIAVIRRGTCGIPIKINNAAAAGAIAVIIANDQAGVFIPSLTVTPPTPATTIPVFSVTQAEGDALRNFGQANPTTTTAQISFPAVGIPNTPDVLASFSSRGPAANFNVLKPDLSAPGVSVLAAVSGTTLIGSENAVNLISGTSMASPHHAGAAMLIRQARPSWTVSEVKSALALTANQTVYTEDSVTLGNPFARGSGRIQVDRAINAGLVMNETGTNYLAADPAANGDPSTLNQPNLINRSCFSICVFNRTFRNTRATGATWRVQVENIRGAFPSFITLAPGGNITVKFTVYGALLPANGDFGFGNVVLTSIPTDGSQPQVLRMPIAVAVQPPQLSLPTGLTMSIPSSAMNSVYFNIGNTGGSTLTYTLSSSGVAPGPMVDNPGNAALFVFPPSTSYTNPQTAGSQAQFAADDFVVTQSTQIRSLVIEGTTFVGPLPTLAQVSPTITWSIFPDASGLPAGNPRTSPGMAVWTYTASSTSAGVGALTDDNGDNIILDLGRAGQSLTLPPGRYWLVVNTNSLFANRWLRVAGSQAFGNNGFATITVPNTGAANWIVNTTAPGLAMQVNIDQPCGASWMGGTFAASGSLARGASRSALTVLYGAGLSPGTYTGRVCVQSNDPYRPTVALPVALTITP
jgi:Subtilase family/PA domain